jgi:hypothetical protein
MGILEVLGTGIIRALVAVRAGPVIAAAALLALAIAAANESRGVDDPLKTFFIAVAMLFGIGAVVVAFLFIIDQIRASADRNFRHRTRSRGTTTAAPRRARGTDLEERGRR